MAAAADLGVEAIATHHEHLWARVPFLGPMAARVDRERAGAAGRLTRLVEALHALLFDHLDREDRVLAALVQSSAEPGLAARVRMLRLEHAALSELLDDIEAELGRERGAAASVTEHALCDELADLGRHLREQIALEEALIAGPSR